MEPTLIVVLRLCRCQTGLSMMYEIEASRQVDISTLKLFEVSCRLPELDTPDGSKADLLSLWTITFYL
jgi:hypothetical protein